MWIESQTLRCIIEGGGDVAFINTLHIKQYLGKNRTKTVIILIHNYNYSNFVLIYTDILRAPLHLADNFDVGNFSTICYPNTRLSADCPLSWSNFGQVSS